MTDQLELLSFGDDDPRVRVVSLRKSGLKAEAGEVVIRVDRANPVLGNPYVLSDARDPIAREEVVARYRVDLEQDFARGGPMSRECRVIAARVVRGERIALACWCKQPRKDVLCHGDLLRAKILEMADQERARSNSPL